MPTTPRSRSRAHARTAPPFVLTDDEHQLLSRVIGPFHAAHLDTLLRNATPIITGGYQLRAPHHDLYDLHDAIGCEILGFIKIEEDDAAPDADLPRPGGTAAQLLAISDKLDQYLT